MSYLTVATAALARGLAVTPLLPGTKQGVLWGWNRHPATTLSEITQHAKDFPNHSVGVVSKGRGIDNVMFFDDDAGVAARIERETGHKLPTLCVIKTRPQSAPWKRHHYFKQTAYSLSELPGKQTNIQDLTRLDDKGKHPTLYDLKAIGKAGLVVAPGSSRPGPDGKPEFYSTGEWHIVDVPPIPDWLVDWFVNDIHQYKSAKATAQAKERREKRERRERPTKTSGFDVTNDGIHNHLMSRRGSFARLGVDREDIEMLLAKQAIKFCEGGKELAASEKGKAKFRRLAFDPKLDINMTAYGPKYSYDTGLVVTPPNPSHYETLITTMAATIRAFPDRILSEEAYDRLQRALKAIDITIDRESTTGKRQAKKARGAAGFEVENVNGTWFWVRID